MQSQFSVEIQSFQKVSKLTNAWSIADFQSMLSIMDFDDDISAMTDADVKEICLMSLADLTPQRAGEVVLQHLFPKLSKGKIEQISHDMFEERSWEAYPDCLYHERFFNAYGLLRDAFNGKFTKPTGVEMLITVSAANSEELKIFDRSAKPAMVRLLASAQDEDALINRLYEEQIQGKDFPEAAGIIWQLDEVSNVNNQRQFKLISSYFWLSPFESLSHFNGTSSAD